MKKLNELSKEELELMSYDDIAYMILETENKKMKINELFKKVCDVLELSDEEFLDRIADFFEILTTDKRFILLKDGFWDLKTKHSERVIIEDEDEELEEIPEEPTEEIEEETFYNEESEDDSSEEDLKDLVIIDEDDDESVM